MPRRNTEDRAKPDCYHCYNRGRDGQAIFRDNEDRRQFLQLLARHLSRRPLRSKRGRFYLHLRERILLLAFCLMTTHFHLVLWQRSPEALALLMDTVLTAYGRYFNEKYNTTAPLFAGPYRAKRVTSAKYFRWLIGYVHENHPSGLDYAFSSHEAWIDDLRRPGWLAPEPGLKVFGGIAAYTSYLEQRKQKRALDHALGFGGARR